MIVTTKRGRRNGVVDALLVYLGYCFKFVSPLLLYPLLTRRLGAEHFGVYAAAYSLALMVSIVVEYGFNLSGTRDIATAPTASDRGRIASEVVTARLLLIPASALIAILLVIANPVLRSHAAVAALAVCLGCAQGSTAFWYFQGVGKVLIAVGLETGGQVLALLATAIFVRNAGHLEMAVALQTAGVTLSAVLGVGLIFREVPFKFPNLERSTRALSGGFAIFLSRAAVTIYTSGSVFLLAAIGGPVQAALYGAADRVVGAASAFLRPLSSLVLPRMAARMVRDEVQGLRLGMQVLVVATTVFAVLGSGVLVFAPTIVVRLFGSSFQASSVALRMLAISLPFVAINTVLGSQIMVSLRMDKGILLVLLAGALINIVLAFSLIPSAGAFGMSVARTSSEVGITLLYGTLLAVRLRKPRTPMA